MKRLLFIFIVNIFIANVCVFGQTRPPAGILLTVNSVADSVDAAPGNRVCADQNGRCTLRAAIEEANAHPGMDVIIFALPAPSVINLTLGELKITSGVSIAGTGARRLTIQRSTAPNTPNFRIFNIFSDPSLSEYLNVFNIRNLKIRNGAAPANASGGGININSNSNSSSDSLITVDLNNLVVTENTAGNGGGIANGGRLRIYRSLIGGNTGVTGGGLSNFVSGAKMQIIDTTINGNTGGGIENLGELVLASDTVSDNIFDGAASGIAAASGSTNSLINTLLKGIGSAPLVSGNFTSYGNNLVTNSQGSTGFSNGVNNDQVGANGELDPKLGDLADNGGQTDTRALLAGSPAIDSGNNCVTNSDCAITNSRLFPQRSDQRVGYYRAINGTTDIGAFEYNAKPYNGRTYTGIGVSYDNGIKIYLNAIATMTNVTTGEKVYAVSRANGKFEFNNNLVTNDLYVLEVNGKRSGISFVTLLPLDFVTYPSLTGNTEQFQVGQGEITVKY